MIAYSCICVWWIRPRRSESPPWRTCLGINKPKRGRWSLMSMMMMLIFDYAILVVGNSSPFARTMSVRLPMFSLATVRLRLSETSSISTSSPCCTINILETHTEVREIICCLHATPVRCHRLRSLSREGQIPSAFYTYPAQKIILYTALRPPTITSRIRPPRCSGNNALW